jgi:hypothetical protein
MNTKRFAMLALAGALFGAPVYLAAQDQDAGQGSVADAARKARAEKKENVKPKMVIDNDNLGTLTGTVNVVGEAPKPAEGSGDKGADDKSAKPGDTAKPEAAKGESYWRQKFTDAHSKLDADAHELDILQREYNLKQQQFYTDPQAALKQDYSRQDLTDQKAKIDQKTAAVDQDKTALSDLEDQLRQAGGDPGWATPAAAPAPQP